MKNEIQFSEDQIDNDINTYILTPLRLIIKSKTQEIYQDFEKIFKIASSIDVEINNYIKNGVFVDEISKNLYFNCYEYSGIFYFSFYTVFKYNMNEYMIEIFKHKVKDSNKEIEEIYKYIDNKEIGKIFNIQSVSEKLVNNENLINALSMRTISDVLKLINRLAN